MPADFGLGVGPGAASGYDYLTVTPFVAASGATAYTVQNNDATILVTAGVAATVNLPAAAQSKGRIVTVKKVDASANAVTLKDVSGANVEGAATKSLAAQFNGARMQSDGTAWWYLSSL